MCPVVLITQDQNEPRQTRVVLTKKRHSTQWNSRNWGHSGRWDDSFIMNLKCWQKHQLNISGTVKFLALAPLWMCSLKNSPSNKYIINWIQIIYYHFIWVLTCQFIWNQHQSNNMISFTLSLLSGRQTSQLIGQIFIFSHCVPPYSSPLAHLTSATSSSNLKSYLSFRWCLLTFSLSDFALQLLLLLKCSFLFLRHLLKPCPCLPVNSRQYLCSFSRFTSQSAVTFNIGPMISVSSVDFVSVELTVW